MYVPPNSVPPAGSDNFRSWLLGELQKIGRASKFIRVFGVQFQVSHSAPDKPRQGLVVYADGTNWNPGSGEGIYRHNGTSWVFVG